MRREQGMVRIERKMFDGESKKDRSSGVSGRLEVLLRGAYLAAVVLAIPRIALAAPAVPQSTMPMGKWEGPYQMSLNNPPPMSQGTYGEIAQSALIPPTATSNAEIVFWPIRGFCCQTNLLPPGCTYNPGSCPLPTMSSYRWEPTSPGSYKQEIVLPILPVVPPALPVATDMFCNGFAFHSNGRLVGAGGTLWAQSCSFCPCAGCSATPPGPCCGFQAVFAEHPNTWQYDRSTQQWTTAGSLNTGRWYPTVVELPDGNLFATGGNSNTSRNSFDIFDGANWFRVSNTAGPLGLTTGQYPRIHVLSSGLLFMTGYPSDSRFLDLTAPNPIWVQGAVSSNLRDDGGSVYQRRWDSVTGTFTESIHIVGGLDTNLPPAAQTLNSVQRIDNPQPTGSSWTSIASLGFARFKGNTVVLPTGDIYEVGGLVRDPVTGQDLYVMAPEILNLSRTLVLPGGSPASSVGLTEAGIRAA